MSGKSKAKKNKVQGKNKNPWGPILAGAVFLLFVVFVILMPKNSNHAPASNDPYDIAWADELNKHLGGCMIASETAWRIQWVEGIGAIAHASYSSENACVRFEYVEIGRANTHEQIMSLIRKEAMIFEAHELMYSQLKWFELVNFYNDAYEYEIEVLGDFIAYRMLSAEDQAILWAMVPGQYSKELWDRQIDCTVIREANEVSTGLQSITIRGGIPNLLRYMGC